MSQATDPTEPTEHGPSVSNVGADREHQIRAAAYQRYLQRGDAPGDPETDWREAEAALFGNGAAPR